MGLLAGSVVPEATAAWRSWPRSHPPTSPPPSAPSAAGREGESQANEW